MTRRASIHVNATCKVHAEMIVSRQLVKDGINGFVVSAEQSYIKLANEFVALYETPRTARVVKTYIVVIEVSKSR